MLEVSARFREMLQPEGCTDELRMSFADDFGVWGHLTLFARRRFTPQETDLAAAVVPHVARALRSSWRDPTSADAPPGDGGPAVIVSAADEPVAADRRALERLADLPTGDGTARPGVVHVLVARARQRDPQRETSALAHGRDGRWWLLDASPLDDEPHGAVAVIVQPAPNTSLLDGLLRAHGLTERERQVARLAIIGRSTKAIAAHLHLSPWTVQDHLKSVFDKAGVGSRADLAILTVGGPAQV